MTHCKKISKFVSKFTIFRKIENLFFQLQQIFFLRILNAKFTWIIWIFAPKIVNQQKWKVYNLTIFWRENSNWNYNLQWFKFIIVLFLLENSIFGYNLRFSKTIKKILKQQFLFCNCAIKRRKSNFLQWLTDSKMQWGGLCLCHKRKFYASQDIIWNKQKW